MLNNKFPGCSLKAIPHIKSKFKWFKDKYAIVSETVNKTSGFQWDDETKMIQCERQAYDDFRKHPSFQKTIHCLEKETIPLDNESDDDTVFISQSLILGTNDAQSQPPPSKRMKKEKTPKSNDKRSAM
uniref:Myb/SANT-like domain-containing protein n=1 Tax=Chenopodium quinoa TaxID=63459 RepID=A0A803NAK1_CHEQI